MRLFITTVSSAVLLAGCSWFGGSSSQNYNGQGTYGSYGGQKAHAKSGRYGNKLGPCQVYHASQPVPRGCDPTQVTLATTGSQYESHPYAGHQSGGFAQQADFAGGYGAGVATGGFGSHASAVRRSTDYHLSLIHI